VVIWYVCVLNTFSCCWRWKMIWLTCLVVVFQCFDVIWTEQEHAKCYCEHQWGQPACNPSHFLYVLNYLCCFKDDMQWFLGVGVNCLSYVFNIIKCIWILRNINNKKIVEKRLKVRTNDLFTFLKWWRHTRKTQPNSLLSVEFWQPIAQQHIGITINVKVGS